jgi:hypothetical protein
VAFAAYKIESQAIIPEAHRSVLTYGEGAFEVQIAFGGNRGALKKDSRLQLPPRAT